MKHVIKTRQNTQQDMAIIILAAGMGERISKKGVRSLYKIGEERLIDRQVDTLHSKFPDADIISVLGFQADRVIQRRHSVCRIVENQLYEHTASGASLRLGINNCCVNKVLVVHGDLYFDHTVFDCIDFNKSGVVSCQMHEDEIGVVSNAGVATNFAYGLPNKWGQIAFFRDTEKAILTKVLNTTDCSKLWTFEILNRVIESRGVLHCFQSDSKVIEIDNPKDVV